MQLTPNFIEGKKPLEKVTENTFNVDILEWINEAYVMIWIVVVFLLKVPLYSEANRLPPVTCKDG